MDSFFDFENMFSLDTIFAKNIYRLIGGEKDLSQRGLKLEKLINILRTKGKEPAEVGHERAYEPTEKEKEKIEKVKEKGQVFIDHAYFSAMILFDKLLDDKYCDFLGEDIYKYMDALTAIELHNSLFKFAIARKKPLKMTEHPLAYMLMLCDELQIWDRTSFGINSKKEEHAMGCDFYMENNRIVACYQYNEEFESINPLSKSLKKFCTSFDSKTLPKDVLEKYSKELLFKKEMDPVLYEKFSNAEFLTDIEEIININNQSGLKLDVCYRFNSDDKYREQGVSESSLLNIYELTLNLYKNSCKAYKYGKVAIDNANVENEKVQKCFESESMAVRFSFINRAKSLAENLSEIGCFFSDKAYALHRIASDSELLGNEVESIVKKEEQRLYREKIDMLGTLFDFEIQTYKVSKEYQLEEKIIEESISAIPGMGVYRLSDPKKYVVVADWWAVDKNNNYIKAKPKNNSVKLRFYDVFHKDDSGKVDYIIPEDKWMSDDEPFEEEFYFADAFRDEFGFKKYVEEKDDKNNRFQNLVLKDYAEVRRKGDSYFEEDENNLAELDYIDDIEKKYVELNYINEEELDDTKEVCEVKSEPKLCNDSQKELDKDSEEYEDEDEYEDEEEYEDEDEYEEEWDDDSVIEMVIVTDKEDKDTEYVFVKGKASWNGVLRPSKNLVVISRHKLIRRLGYKYGHYMKLTNNQKMMMVSEYLGTLSK